MTVLLRSVKIYPLPDDASAEPIGMEPMYWQVLQRKERILKLETEKPEDELSADTERQWGEFRTFYRTENQDPGISFKS